MSWLFGLSSRGLCLVAAHGDFIERRARKEVARKWWREKVLMCRKGAELDMMRAKERLRRGRKNGEQERVRARRRKEEGKKERERERERGRGVPRLWVRFGISRSRRRSDSA
jgi:hypothetical protein